MHPAMNSILRQATRKDTDKLNIITFSTHERYQSNMADVDANFWVINNKNIKLWNETYAKVPNNHILLNDIETILDIPFYLDLDIVLTHERFMQYDFGVQIAKYFHLPMVCLEHICMTPQRESLKKKIGNTNVFISKYSSDSWNLGPNSKVIHHGVNTNDFCNKKIKRENNILSVVNRWVERDYECGYYLWEKVTSGLPTVVVGDNPGLSYPCNNVEELALKYNRSSIFLNTSIFSPIPTTLLEAMSCGSCVVTTSNDMISKIIEHGVNGFISNDPEEITKILKYCMSDESMCRKIGENARKTILENFSLNSFTSNWNKLLRQSLQKNWWEL